MRIPWVDEISNREPINCLGIIKYHHEKIHCGVLRDILAGSRRVRQRGAGGGVSRGRHRSSRRLAGLRSDGADDGLRDRPHLRLSPQSGRFHRALGGRAVPRQGAGALHRLAGARRRSPRAASSTSSPAARPASTSPAASPRTATASIRPAAIRWSRPWSAKSS